MIDMMMWDILQSDAQLFAQTALNMDWAHVDGHRNELASDWNRLHPATPDEIDRYYKEQSFGYLPDLVHWHTREPLRRAWGEEIAAVAGECATFLDFGCGIGTDALTVAHNHPDCRVTMIDFESVSLAFAVWRINKYGITNVDVRAITERVLLDRTWDMICAIDVIEHIGPEYPIHLISWAEHAAKYLALTAPFNDGGDGVHPQHFQRTEGRVEDILAKCAMVPQSQLIWRKVRRV